VKIINFVTPPPFISLFLKEIEKQINEKETEFGVLHTTLTDHPEHEFFCSLLFLLSLCAIIISIHSTFLSEFSVVSSQHSWTMCFQASWNAEWLHGDKTIPKQNNRTRQLNKSPARRESSLGTLSIDGFCLLRQI